MADIWGPLLGALFEVSKKKRMRARKLVKRAVKIAVEKSTFPEESSKRLKNGGIPEFILQDDGLICRRCSAVVDCGSSLQGTWAPHNEENAIAKQGSLVNANGDHTSDSDPSEVLRPPKKKRKKGKEHNSDEGGNEAGVGDADELAWRVSLKRTDVKSGQYSEAEKRTLCDAVEEYARNHGFSTEDYSWLIVAGRGQRGKDTLGVWKTVAASLPNRTIKSVAAAGLRIFHPNACQGKWTAEQDTELLAKVEQRGRKWTSIGAALGRTGDACRDRWREVRLGTCKARGPWTIDEEERLKRAVHEYLETKNAALEESGSGQAPIISLESEAQKGVLPTSSSGAKENGDANVPAGEDDTEKPDRRIVLDDIDWGGISNRVGTRSNVQCLEKWYDQLSPSMLVRGDWGQGDDRRMLRALFRLEAGAEFEIPWGEVVAGRTAAQAKRRWRLMGKAVPDYRNKDFPEILDYLVSKYMPKLKESVGGR